MSAIRIIAEVGSNYDGDLRTARQYVIAAKQCGADTVKFQTLRRDKLVAPKILQGDAWVDNPVYANFNNLELPDDWHFELKKEADKQGIEFMSTPFYLEAVTLLEKVGVKTYKIASGDITFRPLLEEVGKTKKKVLLSTGASGLDDIRNAVEVLKAAGTTDITLLHCVSNYPPQFEEMNLRSLITLKEEFGFPVGISDHTPGNLIPVAAVSLGAVVIEKHITFDRARNGPDHPYAMTVEEFGDMVRQIRLLESALGTGQKEPTADEKAKQHRLRRGVYDPYTKRDTTNVESGLWLRPQHKKS